MLGIKKSEILIATLVSTLFGFLYYLFFPLLSLYFTELGIGEEMLGIIFAFFPLVIIIVSPVVGMLSDDVGRKRIIYFGILAQLLGVILYLWPPSLASIIIARVLAGIAWSMVGLITLAKVEDKLKHQERGSKAGVFLSFTEAGALVGSLVGPFLAGIFFIRFPFLISAIGLALLLIWLVLWRSHHKPIIKKQDFNPLCALKKFWKEKKLRAMAFIGISMHTRIPVMSIFVPLLVIEFGAGYKEVGILFALRGVMALLQGVAGKIVDKKGSRNIVIISVIVASILFILAGFTRSYIALLIVLVAEGLALAFWNISAWTFMSEIGERKKMEGMVLGSYNSLARFGYLIFSIISGFIAVAFGTGSLFIIVGIIALVTVLAFSPMLASKFKVPNR